MAHRGCRLPPTQGPRHDRRYPARLCRTPGAHRATDATGTVVAAAARASAPAPYRFSADTAVDGNRAARRNPGADAMVADAVASPARRLGDHRRRRPAVESAG